MTQLVKCDECGAELPADAPQGLCPHCLMGAGLLLAAAENGAPGEQTSPATADSTTLSAPKSLEPVAQFFGDYELLEEVARGGMGVVYRARQISLNRVVAIKMLLFGKFASEQFVNRFRCEAQAAARLQHPNIVAIHEVGQHQGQDYFTMEYVDGKDLAELTREQVLPAARAARYLQQLAEAIHYAHTRGILHRDLKPSNVLIDANDQPRITDFGIAKRLTDTRALGGTAHQTEPGQVLGSPGFMPPEQAGERPLASGPSNDVYSLGALLFSLLTGRPPFVAETLEGILLQVLQAQPVSPRMLNPGVPRDLETICLKCLEKEPRKRYSTAQELADDLSRFLRGVPISARPLNRAEKLGRWCMRQPAVAALLAIAISLLVSGTTLVVWEWRRAEFQRLRAEALVYVKDMSVAFTDWKETNLMPVLEELERHIPKPSERDLRGFEWRHLWWLSHPRLARTLPKHKQVAGAMSFSANGKILAVHYWDDDLVFWDLDSPSTQLQVITNAVAIGGFLGDGEECIVGTRGNVITLRSTRTGKVLRSVPAGGDLVAVAGNGQILATINSDNILKVLEVPSGKPRFTAPGHVRRRPDSSWEAPVALSFDGRYLAFARPGSNSPRSDDTVEVWDIENGERIQCELKPSRVRCLAFAPNGTTLAVGNGDGSIDLWNFVARSGKQFVVAGSQVLSLAFSPDSRTFAIGGADETIQFLELPIGTRKPAWFPGPLGQVSALTFSPDGKTLAFGGRNSPVNFWSLAQTNAPDSIEELASHEEWGNFTFSPDSKLMAGVCTGGIVKVWEVATLKVVDSLPNATYVMGFSRDSKALLVSTADKTLVWWDFKASTTKPIRKLSLSGVFSADLSPDRRLVALGCEDGTIQLCELDSENPPKSWQAHRDAVLSLKFSPLGDKLISGFRDRSIAAWAVTNQTMLVANDPGEHRGAVCSLAYSRDGTMLASGCGAGMIKLWKESNLDAALANMPYHRATVRTLDFSPDGKTLASGSDDGTVRLINIDQRQEIMAFYLKVPLRLVLFSPDGNTLALVTDAGKLQLKLATPPELVDRELRQR
jgi:WD40 repeat protein/serine/threonine protein kinase